MHVFINNTNVKNYEKERTTNKCFNMLISSISHEFRTPINAFKNSLALIKLNKVELKNAIKTMLGDFDYAKVDSILTVSQKYIDIANIS